ncbi:hypothetical protein [Bacteriovorax sp. Seq25_V]|uniref:hypothetical protein n=1 Tax=Bacteriovorax sp. Seq25_V TaxID=1201288 RepID=UPI000389DD6C|nr:hypothetical protein [Bacteriovorax sp. Seq25_V]EQC47421.1 hypothetical protein M900_0858 [Bacteriovorax sp. Seq25_V]
MKKLFVILSLLVGNSYAKEFYIQANGLRFDLALNKNSRALAVSNYLDFKDMGSITRLEESKPEREDNFLRNFSSEPSDDVTIPSVQVVERKLDFEGFFSCIEEGVSLYSYDLVQKNILTNKKVEIELGVSKCESFLSADFVFPEKKDIFFYYGTISKLDMAGKAIVKDLFLKYLDIRREANEKFAVESLLTMISYDVQFQNLSTVDLSGYKERLKNEILTSTINLSDDIKEKHDFVNASIDSSDLLELVDNI